MLSYRWQRVVRIATAVMLACALAGTLSAAKKKDPDDITQVLELPKDPPAVGIGETRRLVFFVSPLSAKGLLSQQTRDAVHAILKANGNMPIVHIRAFVGGSGDLRRVPQIVSEVLTEKKLPLPSVSVVQIGPLALEGAQVVLEAVSLAKKDVNPDGLGFVSGSPEELAKSPGLLAVTCFAGTGGLAPLASKFPGAAVNVVQALRAPVSSETLCEGVTRGGAVKAEKLAFTGTRIALGQDEKAAGVAFQRLDRDLAEAGAAPSGIVATSIYALTERVGEMARALRGKGAVVIPVEGVASLDGVFAVDAVADITKQEPTKQPSAP